MEGTGQGRKKDISVIGAAVVDVLAGPVGAEIFQNGSRALEYTKMSFGGDALNESVVLSRLGKRVELLTKLGGDEAGNRVRHFMKENGLPIDNVQVDKGLETGINIVLVDKGSERIFLTNPKSSLRKFAETDILPYVDHLADIVSFASLFVSFALDIPAMERLFRKIKEKPGRILALDTTSPKFGETLQDLKPILPYVDYFLPNNTEAELLTGEADPYINAELLLQAGLSCAVLKCGREGCLIRKGDAVYSIPAYPGCHAVDSTGAGDSFAAGFLWALSQGMALPDCGRFACAVASLAVEHVGATEGIRSLEEPMRRFREMGAASSAVP